MYYYCVLFYCVYKCIYVCQHRVHPSFGESTYVSCSLSPSLFVHLLAVLVFLLLELPVMGLDGGGGLVSFNGAERRNRRGASPIAGIGVWARQDTWYSQRGSGNSHGDIVCSNDWVQRHGVQISLDSSGLFFWFNFELGLMLSFQSNLW